MRCPGCRRGRADVQQGIACERLVVLRVAEPEEGGGDDVAQRLLIADLLAGFEVPGPVDQLGLGDFVGEAPVDDLHHGGARERVEIVFGAGTERFQFFENLLLRAPAPGEFIKEV